MQSELHSRLNGDPRAPVKSCGADLLARVGSWSGLLCAATSDNVTLHLRLEVAINQTQYGQTTVGNHCVDVDGKIHPYGVCLSAYRSSR